MAILLNLFTHLLDVLMMAVCWMFVGVNR